MVVLFLSQYQRIRIRERIGQQIFVRICARNLQIEPITPHIDALSKFSSSEDDSSKGVTRLVYSKEDLEARAYVKNLMTKNGLKVREDAMGSIFGRLEGLKKSQKGGGLRGRVWVAHGRDSFEWEVRRSVRGIRRD